MGPQTLARATRPFLLTFDDGPDGVNKLGGGNLTEKVLNTLCEKGVQAGFFVQTAAQNAKGKPFRGSSPIGETLIKRMSSEGHLVGIHTGGKIDHESHPKALAAKRLPGELSGAKFAINKLTGKTPTLVRPPFGSSNKAVRALYKTLGLTNVLWDIDGDAKASSLADIKRNITADLKGVIARGWKGSTPLAPEIVALFHDIRPNTAKNVGAIIDFIKSETTALTAGKDTASFPSISCKTPAAPAGSEFGPGDFPSLPRLFEPSPMDTSDDGGERLA
jgi:peptidoglycan/xylan/chitin deacetylase (PgdA/CDA1 family)